MGMKARKVYENRFSMEVFETAVLRIVKDLL